MLPSSVFPHSLTSEGSVVESVVLLCFNHAAPRIIVRPGTVLASTPHTPAVLWRAEAGLLSVQPNCIIVGRREVPIHPMWIGLCTSFRHCFVKCGCGCQRLGSTALHAVITTGQIPDTMVCILVKRQRHQPVVAFSNHGGVTYGAL